MGICGCLPNLQTGESFPSIPPRITIALPIPQRPWSHLSMDFVIGFPPSQCKTTIQVIVDQFSKACRFIPLPKLPSDKEMAEIVIEHVFWVFRIPQHTDRGPQFSSCFWHTLCQLLGTTVSLSSGLHPESNGQIERLS